MKGVIGGDEATRVIKEKVRSGFNFEEFVQLATTVIAEGDTSSTEELASSTTGIISLVGVVRSRRQGHVSNLFQSISKHVLTLFKVLPNPLRVLSLAR
ncbi:UNVERIFIED_CONTAM: hypothetical protein Sradi_5107800 [Sesamum radiatum]|uniref:Uncharacterized protein n=1 Tax=Sesamum radiatum TaxID=300843 RepID=A0AAW2M1P6_SESRA